LSDRFQVQHLFDARHNDEFAAPILLSAFVRVVRGNWVRFGKASGAPAIRGKLPTLVPHEKQKHLSSPHERQAPVVAEHTSRERLVVGVASHLVVARGKRWVRFDDACNLKKNLLPFLLKRLATRIEEHITW